MNKFNNKITPDLHLPTEIYIRNEIAENIAQIVSGYGNRVIIITISDDFELYSEEIEAISRSLKEYEIGCIIYDQLPMNPNTEDIDFAVSFTQKTNCDVIIGFGGVESINSGKAIALLTNNHIFCYDLLTKSEVVNPPIPFITMPAYPIYGFEIAPVLYLDEIHDSTKKIYFNKNISPVATIVDPTFSLKVDEIKAIKLSISTLAISAESVISTNNNDIINTYALKSIDLIFRNLPIAFKDTQNLASRTYLATSSVMSGITFSIAYLSVTMSIALALASKTDITVESAMSVILPHIMEFNLTSSPGKYVQMSKVMGEDVKDITVIEAAIKTVEAIRKLELDVGIQQKLSQYNIEKNILNEISGLAMGYPFIENTPRALNVSEIETILLSAF